MYPNFFRTVPDDEMQYVAIVKLLERMKWNWVGIITSDDEYGEREIRHLSKHLTNHGICIEVKILVSKENCEKKFPELRTSSTEVLIICGSVTMNYYKFLLGNIPYYRDKTLILPDSWSMGKIFSNYSLVFTYPNLYTGKFNENYKSFNLSCHPDDPLLEDILISELGCFSKNQRKNFFIPQTTGRPLTNCNLEPFSTLLHFDNDVTPFRVYIAVFMLASALYDMYYFYKINNKKTEINSNTLRYKLSRYVKEIRYNFPNDKVVFFNDKGELPSPLEITNIIRYDELKDVTYSIPVGHFDGSLSEGQQLTLKPELISWKGNKVSYTDSDEKHTSFKLKAHLLAKPRPLVITQAMTPQNKDIISCPWKKREDLGAEFLTIFSMVLPNSHGCKRK
ncbi:extracellular calcium-sensing receptor-like [Mantella aurantiaca]